MKKLISVLLIVLFLLCACNDIDQKEASSAPVVSDLSNEAPNVYSDDFSVNESDYSSFEESKDVETEGDIFMKAVWISQFDMVGVLKENGAQRDRNSFIALYRTMLENVKKDGYNTVIVQVRPYADSFYPSDLFPISNYVSGSFGIEDIYDPFEIIVKLSKELGLTVHAWLNPMRGMKISEIESVPDKYLIKQWYLDANKRGNYIVEFGDRFYLNPAYEEVRSLIASGASEVSTIYDIDGVHIDDYFYPTKEEAFDRNAYNDYKSKGGTGDLKSFRREMLDLMVKEMYCSIKAVDETLLFGISPAGNINNTYNDLYTDVYKWCSEDGYIDYICPQIYFGLEHQTHDFIKVYNTWNNIIKNDKVKMFAGLSLGKAKSGVDNYAGTGKNEWATNKDVIKRCLEFVEKQDDCGGIVMFCYQHMYDPITGESVKETEEERDNMKNVLNRLR